MKQGLLRELSGECVVGSPLDCAGDRRGAVFVDGKPEDVWPGVMAYDIEVILGARDLVEIDVGGQNAFAVKRGSGEHASQGIDDATAAGA